MGIRWNEGDEIIGAIYIGKVSDAENKRVAAIAITMFRVTGSVKMGRVRQWLLEPLELCLVEDSAEGLKFTSVWQKNDADLNERKASKQKAFTEAVGEFGPDADIKSYGNLITSFFEDQLIEANEKTIADLDTQGTKSENYNERGTIRPAQYGGSIPTGARREKGIWQFVATDVSKKDDDERLTQMEHIARMGRLMLDNGPKNEQRKRIQSLN